ncbi:uncharacterized protein LOC126892097 [Diabrotica virgifera virgifera]|uniref:CCHC-type domain-containing protein n=1 Tax=Diabrotica virgifera virgifera TaxID=50390 RepID=A0ABM5L4X0_DIAVI|nr:uncharacterized protein LOC126892097 [Diabrotica virgifera virgifera]
MPLPFNLNHLKTEELAYELTIRGSTVPENVAVRRKSLRALLTEEKKTAPEYKLTPAFTQDVKDAKKTYQELKTLVEGFTGTSATPSYRTISDRFQHLSERARRMAASDEKEEETKQKFKMDVSILFGELEEKLGNPQDEEEPQHFSSTPIASPSFLTASKPIPVHKWGIRKFSGGTNLIPFLEQLNVLKQSRGCKDSDLFLSAGDLFEGSAFTWWHNHYLKKSFASWDELVSTLKQTYLPDNYDRALWEQIRTKQQGPDEPFFSFIADCEALFNRLEKNVSEAERVEEIRLGLLPDFVMGLAMVKTPTVADLINACKCIETSRAICSSRSKQSTSLPQRFRETCSLNVICWNCRTKGHVYQDCQSEATIFCYSCGRQRVTKARCPKCSNVQKNDHTGVTINPPALSSTPQQGRPADQPSAPRH